jgi:NAD(P)H-dependent FMN reductase
MKIGIILGTTREGRLSPQVGNFLKQYGDERKDATYEVIDLKEYKLPFLGDEDIHNGIDKWNQKLSEFDGFIFVAAEYNHSIPAVLKNALDLVKSPWINKACAIASYGSVGGARSAEHLRAVFGELSMADVRTNPAFSLFLDFKDGKFAPREVQMGAVKQMFDDIILWSKAMSTIRA